MNAYLLAQTAPVKLITQEAAPVVQTPASTIDPLWVLLGLIAAAITIASVLIARTVWVDLLTRRPADAALGLLLLRQRMGVRSYLALRKLASELGPDVHAVALVCSPSARMTALRAATKSKRPPKELDRYARTIARLDRA